MRKHNSYQIFFRAACCILLTLISWDYAYSGTGKWPHMRGPNYNAHADDITIHIDKGQQFPVVWETRIGQGYSGCVIADGRDFTQAQNRGGQYVLCLDVFSGKELWRTRYGWPWDLKGQYPGPYSTPTWHEGRIYFTGCYGELGCLDAETGRKIWSLDLKEAFGVRLPSFGYACTPLIHNGKIYLTLGEEGGSVFALNADDGSLVWKSGDHAASYSSPVLISVSGNKQIVSFLENVLISNDPDTGAELWELQISEGYDEHSVWPVFEDPFLFCASPFFRDAHVVELSYDDGKPVMKPTWRSNVISNDIFSSVIVKGFIYGFHIEKAQADPIGKTEGSFKCIELTSGREMWNTRAPGHVNVLAAQDKLVLFSEDGVLIIAGADPEKYVEITRQRIIKDSLCWTFPAICNGKLFLRGGEYLVCVDLYGKSGLGDRDIEFKTTNFLTAAAENWLHRYEWKVFVNPSYKQMGLWFLFSVIILTIAGMWAFLSSFFVEHSLDLFFVIALILSLTGPVMFSPLCGEFVFTWPVALFVSYIKILCMRSDILKRESGKSQLFMRGLLVLFVLICFGYYQLCQSLFIVVGIGFLVGIVPLTPLGLFLARYADNKISLSFFFGVLAAFSVYFWFSAFFIVWKTG